MQMGCSASKVDNEEVVLMCRERKRFIKQAVDQRYVLAAAHVDYFQALVSIGESLRKFAEGEMQLLSSLPAPASPTVSSHEKKSPEHAAVPEKSSTTSSLHLHSDSHSHSHHSHSHSHSPSESPPAESPTSSPFHEHSESPPLYGSPHYNYMRSVNTRATTVEERPVSPERVAWNSYSSDNQYGIDSFFGISMGQNRSPPTADTRPGPSYSSNNPPPPPSPPKNNAWDFFNPFVSYEAEGVYYPYYGRSRLSPASEGSSRDSKHVREEEGIPDLEEEDQGEDGKKKVQWEKKVDEKGKAYNTWSPDNVVEDSTRSVAHPNPDESIEEKNHTKGTEGEAGEKAEREAADVPVDKSVLENRVDNENNDFALLVTQGKKNMMEVLVEVENEFKRAHDSSKELGKMLETNKVPYRPRFSVFKVLSARILNAITWHQAKPSAPSSSKRPYFSKPKNPVDDSGDAFDEDYGMNSGSHLSTLDKIYAWEKKLYEEVKAGEKIRIEYEKKITQLRLHNDKGEDPHLVDATRTAIKSLQTRIKVAMQVVDSISKRIHMLRDEELQPQVAELVQGFMRMWKVMLDCHQRQNKIVAVAKSLGRVAASDVSNEIHLKETIRLESELQNWHACFRNWVGAQRAYVQALNGWLLKCIHQEPEQTSDGLAPFSPRRVGAPPVFVICNDWSQSFRDMPENQVVDAIEKLAAAVKKVYTHQDEEQRQKRKAEFLEKDLVGRVHLVEKMESRLHEPQPSSDKKHESDIGQASAGLAEQKMSIESFRKQVEAENARHHTAMQNARNVTLSTLQTDLKHVFETLVEFTSSALKTYEQLVHSERENLSQANGEHEREDFSHANGETSYVKDA